MNTSKEWLASEAATQKAYNLLLEASEYIRDQNGKDLTSSDIIILENNEVWQKFNLHDGYDDTMIVTGDPFRFVYIGDEDDYQEIFNNLSRHDVNNLNSYSSSGFTRSVTPKNIGIYRQEMVTITLSEIMHGHDTKQFVKRIGLLEEVDCDALLEDYSGCQAIVASDDVNLFHSRLILLDNGTIYRHINYSETDMDVIGDPHRFEVVHTIDGLQWDFDRLDDDDIARIEACSGEPFGRCATDIGDILAYEGYYGLSCDSYVAPMKTKEFINLLDFISMQQQQQ